MEGGRLVIDTGQCNNCRDCIEACPFEVINLAPAKAADPCVSSSEGEVRLVGNKCDLCLGREQGPVCVAACPYQALRLADPAADKREKNRQAAHSSQYLYRMGR
jgi:electron transport protein HydN